MPKKPDKSVILVGTYRRDQLEKWVLPKGLYNYPIHEEDAAIKTAAPTVTELWLYAGKADKRRFTAKFKREISGADLDALGYPRGKGKPHSDRYLLFQVEPLEGDVFQRGEVQSQSEASSPSEPRPRILVRLTDFKRSAKRLAEIRKAAAVTSAAKDAKGAKAAKPFSYLDFLPEDLLTDWADSLCACEKAEQLDFYDLLFCLQTPGTKTVRGVGDEYNFISLFSGAGGLDIGFREIGFNCLLASDIMPEACDTYRRNNLDTRVICTDIRQLQTAQIRDIIGSRKVDVIVGGPPCQGFSNMGNKNSGDPRNLLFESYVRIVNDIKPTCFLFENVKGLYTMFEGRFFRKVVSAFAEIGYDLYCSVLNTANYGVPQKRERIIIVGTQKDIEFRFPCHSSNTIGRIRAFANVGEAIDDLVDRHEEVPNHIALAHGEIVTARYKLIPEGGKLPPPDQLPAKLRRGNFGNTYQRLSRNAVASTMVPGNNAFPIHPKLDRSLTPREAARIQTFPDDYIFEGDRRSQCIQVGNAVPPLFAAKLAQAIMDHLRGAVPSGLPADKHFARGVVIEPRSLADKRATLTFADLFCGAGGFTQGLEDAGLRCLLGVDFEKNCTEAYRINHQDHECLKMDLSSQEAQEFVGERLKKEGVDLIVGGPPCQGFSIFGKRRFVNTKNHDVSKDKRNNLVFAFANIVRIASPRWFIMENVPGIVTARGGEYIREIKEYFLAIGYRIDSRVINAADYGAPQLRHRFLLVGTRTNLMFPWPKPKYYERPESWQQPYRTVGEALMDLSDESTHSRYKNHNPPHHNAIVSRRMAYIPEGEKMDVTRLPPELAVGVKTKSQVSNYSKVFYRLSRKRPAPTVVPGHNAFPVHPTLNRTLTVREAARLQTFPDDYEFVGPIINQALQVGNAFPCIVAQMFGERLRTVENCGWKDGTATTLARKSMFGGK